MTWTDKIESTRNQLRTLNKAIPEASKGFATLSKSVKESGVLEFKHKEYVALGIAVATRCEACIAFHVDAWCAPVPPARRCPTSWQCASRWVAVRR